MNVIRPKIKAVYRKAVTLVSQSTEIVVIGYSFNPHDNASYGRILSAAAGRRVLLVGPDAHSLVERLASDHPYICWKSAPLSFQEWVRNDYPGVSASGSVV